MGRISDPTAIGAVLRNWPHVFSILNLFGESSPFLTSNVRPNVPHHAERPPSPPSSPSRTNTERDEEPDEPLPQLVRLPYAGEAWTIDNFALRWRG